MKMSPSIAQEEIIEEKYNRSDFPVYSQRAFGIDPIPLQESAYNGSIIKDYSGLHPFKEKNYAR
jgi:hypothetical protein